MQEKWDKIYAEKLAPSAPARVVAENAHLLPNHGAALDFACGLGANALFLARRGLSVSAWDLSPVAIEKVVAQANAQGLSVQGEVRDVTLRPLPENAFDVIVVAHFLDRSLIGALIDALKPHGLIFYQTYSKSRVDDSGPRNPAFRLDDNELLRLFGSLRLVVYREEGCIGEVTQGFRNCAMLVAQKV